MNPLAQAQCPCALGIALEATNWNARVSCSAAACICAMTPLITQCRVFRCPPKTKTPLDKHSARSSTAFKRAPHVPLIRKNGHPKVIEPRSFDLHERAPHFHLTWQQNCEALKKHLPISYCRQRERGDTDRGGEYRSSLCTALLDLVLLGQTKLVKEKHYLGAYISVHIRSSIYCRRVY